MWPFDKTEDKVAPLPQDQQKQIEENKIYLSGMTELANKLNMATQQQQTGLDYETWKRRVLKEGRGY